MTATDRTRLATLRRIMVPTLAEMVEIRQLTGKMRQEKQNRSDGQHDRLHREYAAGYYAYLSGAAIAGGAPADIERYITVPEAARRLGLSRQRVYVLVRTGRLEAVRIGSNGPWLVDGDRLEQRKEEIA